MDLIRGWARISIAGAAMAALMCGCVFGPAVHVKGEPRRGGVSGEEDALVTSTAELHGFPQEDETQVPAGDEETEEAWRKANDFAYGPYLITAGDVLDFRSFDDESINSQVIVRYDGHISLPWIKDLKIDQLTREEATEEVREAYSEIYGEPLVSLQVVTANGKGFLVMGQVNQPSTYPYTRPISVLDGITIAGGLRVSRRSGDSFVGAQGQLVKAFVIRNDDGERVVREFDLRGLQQSGPHPADTPIFPGDIIYVPEGINLIYIMGAVGRPDVVELRDGSTLLQILASSQGFVEQTARMRRIVLLRQVDDEHTKVMHINVRTLFRRGEDVVLLPGDIIYLPRKPLINLADFVQRFTGTISPLLTLYTQAYDVFHLSERFNFNNFGGTQALPIGPIGTPLPPRPPVSDVGGSAPPTSE